MSTLYVREGEGYREASFGDVMSRAQGMMAQRYRTGSPALLVPAILVTILRCILAVWSMRCLAACIWIIATA